MKRARRIDAPLPKQATVWEYEYLVQIADTPGKHLYSLQLLDEGNHLTRGYLSGKTLYVVSLPPEYTP